MIESQYIPGIAYFSLLVGASEIIIDRHENYIRQTYRNRSEILGANGAITLTVPVERGRSKQRMSDAKVDNSARWQKIHWRSIQSAYGKSPFFEYYADQLVACYEKRYRFLLDVNHDLMSCLLGLSDLSIEYSYSENYIDTEHVDIQDCRSLIIPGHKGAYQEKLSILEYPQVFGSKFVPGLSLIDLLFCEGPNTVALIREMAKTWQ